MTAKRTSTKAVWHEPTTEELLVLQRQITAALPEGEAIKRLLYGEGDWGPWDTNLGDLIARALGPDSPQANNYHVLSFGGPNTDGMSAERAELIERQWRNESIDRSIAQARGALKAIEQELERHGARPVAGSTLAAEAFTFVNDVAVRAIAQRDYDELRNAPAAVKTRALLAGSVIEALLLDGLERKAFTRKQTAAMSFHELITEAAGAGLIQPRTSRAAGSLRELRNLVHPAVELRDGRLRSSEADAAVSLMRLVMDDLR